MSDVVETERLAAHVAADVADGCWHFAGRSALWVVSVWVGWDGLELSPLGDAEAWIVGSLAREIYEGRS